MVHMTSGFAIGGDKRGELCGRCFPQNDFGEGQFVAKLIKNNAKSEEICRKQGKNPFVLTSNELKNAKSLEKECFGREKFKFFKVKNAIYVYDGEPLPLQNIVMLGVCFAKIENKRLVIHHQLFKAYGNEMINKLDLNENDERVKKYAMGQEIETSLKGYVCVMVDGVPLGGGKASQGVLKNYYPKGLRAQISDY